MNEERKPKKLNIKKIAVVALSVIMIMATFCISAFADNPLTNKKEYVLGITKIQSLEPTFTNETEEYSENFMTSNELDVTITFIDKSGNEFSSAGLKIKSVENSTIEISTLDSYRVIARYDKVSKPDEWILAIDNKYTIVGGTDSDYEEISAEEAVSIITNTIYALTLNTTNINMDNIISSVKAVETRTTGILSTFLGIATWIGCAVSALIGMFYLNGSLTFIGYLAVAGIAVSVIFLLIYLISSFLKFRG